MSSHDVVARGARARSGGVATGHAGTLDPFATGLLLVLVGRATKSQRVFMALPKRYETRRPARRASRARATPRARSRAPGGSRPTPPRLPTGEVRQRPPALLGGEGRRRARLPPRAPRRGASRCPSGSSRCTASSELWRRERRRSGAPRRRRFEIECGSGTYVRSLIADLGDALLPGAAAHRDRAVRGVGGGPRRRARGAAVATPAAARRSSASLEMVARGAPAQ